MRDSRQKCYCTNKRRNIIFVPLQPSIESIEFCNLGSRIATSRNLEVLSALIVCKDSSRPRRAILIVQIVPERLSTSLSMHKDIVSKR